MTAFVYHEIGYDDTSYGDNNTDYTLYNESYTTYDAVDLDNNG